MDSATESLIERLKAATMGFDWADLPDDAAIPAVPLLRQAAAGLEALRSRCERMERERDEAFEQCAKIAEADMRSPMAIASGHKPEWYKHGLSIAKRIRNAARALQQGGKAE